MDKLINCLEKFNINENFSNFDDELESVIDNLNDTHIYGRTTDMQWKILSQNYSKLKYIVDILRVFPVKTIKFYRSMDNFFEYIDRVNQAYLRDIDWYTEDEEMYAKCFDAKFLLEESLNISDREMKLSHVFQAYEYIIYIAEYYRKEKHIDAINDENFINTFCD